jgi:ElaB/YqjD/DUF883 family membrane-anchored ribosome-binding protein
MAHETRDAATGVASTAGEEAREVASEAKDQARRLLEETRTELTDRATSEQERLAQGLRQLSDQLSRMAGHADDGVARDLVGDVAGRTGDLAGWLEHRDPGEVLDEARRFARRRPGTFLAVAAGLGVVAGRMTRGLAEEKRDEHSSATSSGTGTGGRHAAETPPAASAMTPPGNAAAPATGTTGVAPGGTTGATPAGPTAVGGAVPDGPVLDR